MDLEVTPEMQRAVCKELGHEIQVDQVLVFDGRGATVANVDGKVPHLLCARCPTTWLVIEQPGEDYDDAEAKLKARLRDGDVLKTRLDVEPAAPVVEPGIKP